MSSDRMMGALHQQKCSVPKVGDLLTIKEGRATTNWDKIWELYEGSKQVGYVRGPSKLIVHADGKYFDEKNDLVSSGVLESSDWMKEENVMEVKDCNDAVIARVKYQQVRDMQDSRITIEDAQHKMVGEGFVKHHAREDKYDTQTFDRISIKDAAGKKVAKVFQDYGKYWQDTLSFEIEWEKGADKKALTGDPRVLMMIAIRSDIAMDFGVWYAWAQASVIFLALLIVCWVGCLCTCLSIGLRNAFNAPR
eukprot:CAMPEP_0181309358 /NCGR_PEP_ID=MMETSP1101-20121128/11969_1 /TAXON_ID=46948 /ORGANISM="Rhodomonas abbreviata, Strain Caron Lab Isolate" /LENGTH=249 /DNA_ID=CAMNT_0023415833 /DNA_START=178 /DNA_END=927 /DNA_ORIENTATION=-